jgi:hypothetical protein
MIHICALMCTVFLRHSPGDFLAYLYTFYFYSGRYIYEHQHRWFGIYAACRSFATGIALGTLTTPEGNSGFIFAIYALHFLLQAWCMPQIDLYAMLSETFTAGVQVMVYVPVGFAGNIFSIMNLYVYVFSVMRSPILIHVPICTINNILSQSYRLQINITIACPTPKATFMHL